MTKLSSSPSALQVATTLLLAALSGCNASTESNVASQAAAQSAGQFQDNSVAPTSRDDSSPSELATALFETDDVAPSDANAEATPSSAEAASGSSLKLRADLSPERLSEFLKLADLEMQNIASGKAKIFDNAKANQEMVRIGKLKLQAATQLHDAETASEDQKNLGIRGQLQSLSHLAALGDLKSAQELEALAIKHSQNDNATVAEDSLLVLVGLALERVQNGSRKDADEVMQHIRALVRGTQTPSIAGLMVMGQGRAVLEKYGFNEAASEVRETIVDLFASHPDPNIASMAMQIAGTPRFTAVDQLLRQLDDGQPVTIEKWRSEVKALLDESPDLAAVQFLASAALQNEAGGRVEFAESTYDLLGKADQLDERGRREIEVAMTAYKARRDIIGKPLTLDLPSTDGRPLTLQSYAGKVILMPFWSIEYPDSLSILQRLADIREQYDGKVEIIGVNLDRADAPFEEFLEQSPVRFRSFHSESTPGQRVVNKTAERFGIVAMPFVVVVSPEGKVAAIDYTGQKLEEVINQLLDNSDND